MKNEQASAHGLPAWLDGRTVALIGTVCTVGLGVAAANFASTSAIRAHIDTRIGDVNTRITGVEASLNTRIMDVEKNLNRRITDVEKSLNRRITDAETSLNRRITDADTSLNRRITDADTSLSTRITDAETSLNTRITATETSLKARITDTNTRITDLGGSLNKGIDGLDSRLRGVEVGIAQIRGHLGLHDPVPAGDGTPPADAAQGTAAQGSSPAAPDADRTGAELTGR